MSKNEEIKIPDNVIIDYLLPLRPSLEADTQVAKKKKFNAELDIIVKMFVFFAESSPGMVISNDAVCIGLDIEKKYYKYKLTHVRRTLESVHGLVFHNIRSKGYCVAVGDQARAELLKSQLRAISHAFSAFRIASINSVVIGDDKISRIIKLLRPIFADLLSMYNDFDEDEKEILAGMFKSDIGVPDFISNKALISIFERRFDGEDYQDH